MTDSHHAAQLELERIFQSETLRSSEALRRLLRYLADKTISGEADQLEEHTVGVEALHKPESYDPRRGSAVRIQIGRPRQPFADVPGLGKYTSGGAHNFNEIMQPPSIADVRSGALLTSIGGE